MSIRKHKLQNLINGSLEAYYWLGFLLADGHFSKTNRLVVALQQSDRNHLEKMKTFLGVGEVTIRESKLNPPVAQYSVMDVGTLRFLKERFAIVSNKTISPPNLISLTPEELFAVSIGFIDGDGAIQFPTGRTDAQLAVKCHAAWKNTLEYIFKVPVRINSAGYAYFCITDNTKLREIKNKAIQLNLPIMDRKWSKIDLNRESRMVIAQRRRSEVRTLYSQGLTLLEISTHLDLKYTTVWQLLNRKDKLCKKA